MLTHPLLTSTQKNIQTAKTLYSKWYNQLLEELKKTTNSDLIVLIRKIRLNGILKKFSPTQTLSNDWKIF